MDTPTLLIGGRAVAVRDAEQALEICEKDLTHGTALLISKNHASVRVIRAGAVRAYPEVYTIDRLAQLAV